MLVDLMKTRDNATGAGGILVAKHIRRILFLGNIQAARSWMSIVDGVIQFGIISQ